MTPSLADMTIFAAHTLVWAFVSLGGAVVAAETRVGEDVVLVDVDGYQITEKMVEDEVEATVAKRTKYADFPPSRVEQMRKQLRTTILERRIDDRLLEVEIEKAGIAITDDEIRAAVRREVEAYAVRHDVSLEYAAGEVSGDPFLPLEAFLAASPSDPRTRNRLLQDRLLAKLHPAETTVTDDAIAARYESLRKELTFPERVRARHIITDTRGMADKPKAKALRRAQEMLELARAPGADFIALACEHSQESASKIGGDLGYFSRDMMVAPFADAAFALPVGGMSEIVESPFGYHVILSVDHREARRLPLEEVADALRLELQREQSNALRTKLAAQLRASARVAYTPARRLR